VRVGERHRERVECGVWSVECGVSTGVWCVCVWCVHALKQAMRASVEASHACVCVSCVPPPPSLSPSLSSLAPLLGPPLSFVFQHTHGYCMQQPFLIPLPPPPPIPLLAQLLQGTASHKKMADDTNWLLKIYYHNQVRLLKMY
jgi:hypothetical protein